MSQYDLMLNLKIKVGHCDLYFMVSDFALYLEDYFMYKAVTLAGGICEPLLTCSSLLLSFGKNKA